VRKRCSSLLASVSNMAGWPIDGCFLWEIHL
jgi:hypothetical protein